MLLYVTVINCDVTGYYPISTNHYFDSIHKDRLSAEKRCKEIEKGINLPQLLKTALNVYNAHLNEDLSFMLFEAEVIPYQLEKNPPHVGRPAPSFQTKERIF